MLPELAVTPQHQEPTIRLSGLLLVDPPEPLEFGCSCLFYGDIEGFLPSAPTSATVFAIPDALAVGLSAVRWGVAAASRELGTTLSVAR